MKTKKCFLFVSLLILSTFLKVDGQTITTKARNKTAVRKVSKDPEVNNFLKNIKKGKLPTSALGPVADILNKLGASVIKGEIFGINTAELEELPREMKRTKAIAVGGSLNFLNENVKCKIIFGKQVDTMGKFKTGFSLSVSLPKTYKVKDLSFLSSLGVSAADLGKFGEISLPKPQIIFSTFDSYTEPDGKFSVDAGVTVSTKTNVSSLMSMVRKEVNNLTGGKANKLPFIARVRDNSPVLFNLALGFKGSEFRSFKGMIGLPMELGVNLSKLRAQERRFRPNIKAPFTDLNKPIKEVTGILNKSPLKEIKDITVGNFVTSIGIEQKTFKLSFGAELNVTTNKGDRYGVRGILGLTPEQLAIELQKSPSIQSMPLGGGVSIENIALATYTDFKVLATTGSPFSGLGLLGEIKFPFEGDKVTIGLAGQIEVNGNFMMMGSVKNLNATKLAQFNAQLISNLAKAVNFDTSKLTEAMNQLPKIVIKEGMIYVATKAIKLGGRSFPMGLGVSLDVTVDKHNGKLSVAGNDKELSFLGYLSEIKTPLIIISGSGPDKKHNTKDDGPIIDFLISADQPKKSKFDASGKISFPPVNIAGSGDVTLGISHIGANFSSNISNLFKAQFDLNMDAKNIPASKIGFELNATERRNFIGKALKQLDREIAKAQRGAAKILLAPFRAITSELAKGISKLNIAMPRRIYAKLTARDWSGSMGIDGGNLVLPGIGSIKLNIPNISFSLKNPAKAIAAIAEKWANLIVREVTSTFEKVGKEIEKGAKTAVRETGKAAATVGRETEKAAKTTAKKAKKVVEDIGDFFSGW